MSSTYDIGIDRSRGFYRLSLVGTLDAHAVASFTQDLRKRVETSVVQNTLNPVSLLVDLRKMDLQARDIASMIKDSIENGAALWTKIAVLLPLSPLHILQVKRLSQHGNHAFFRDEGEATNWLST